MAISTTRTATKRIICLFDVDGTLSKPRQSIKSDLDRFLQEKIKPLSNLGIVGGSDFVKIAEQMNGEDVINRYDYVFAENGLIRYEFGRLTGQESIQHHLGEQKLQTFINFTLKLLSEIVLPVKRGTFIEFRTGMLNVSPIGRSCSQSERDAFEIYDKTNGVRKGLIAKLQQNFPDFGLTYSIGGQISFDVFPTGWDKTYCLQYLDGYDEIHFFGDKTFVGGNDYEIFMDSRTIGHTVKNPEDTYKQLELLFNLVEK